MNNKKILIATIVTVTALSVGGISTSLTANAMVSEETMAVSEETEAGVFNGTVEDWILAQGYYFTPEGEIGGGDKSYEVSYEDEETNNISPDLITRYLAGDLDMDEDGHLSVSDAVSWQRVAVEIDGWTDNNSNPVVEAILNNS